VTKRTVLLSLASLLISTATTCTTSSTNSCPTNACAPEIALGYGTPIAGSYEITVELLDVFYKANCPSDGGPSASPPRLTCDENGIVLAGIDLGHGDVEELDMNVQIVTADAMTPYAVTATLQSIANSESCELVCYRHVGSVGN
jgi:hypothetical protein